MEGDFCLLGYFEKPDDSMGRLPWFCEPSLSRTVVDTGSQPQRGMLMGTRVNSAQHPVSKLTVQGER